jgi:hypothetical protein
MNKSDDSKKLGRFVLGPANRTVHGELTLAGGNSTLHLHDENEFDPHAIPGRYIQGVLNDLVKVSLLGCVTTQGLGHTARGDETYYSANLFPHFVVSGDCHIAPDERTITKIHFSVDDAATLFYDFDAFGFILDGSPLIEEVVKVNETVFGRKIKTGLDSNILYFAGKREIIACDTEVGKFSVNHNPQPTSLGGPTGVGLKNTILISIEFKERLTLQESIDRISAPLRYLEILVGRPQNIVALTVRAESDHHTPTRLQVYWSLVPKRENAEREPKSYDLLLDAVRQPSEFSGVLTNWIARDEARLHARVRFASSFSGQNQYTVDRIIGAANMFDILPASAGPSEVAMTKELETTRNLSRDAFLALPPSPERDSVLTALGRVGKASLKRKIRHRVEKITREADLWFPDLLRVTDEAVNCRNYYVHGSEPRFDYERNFGAVTFFIDALEFVFAASDFVEAGWDIKSWCGRGTMMSHPFSRFRISYAQSLADLKKLLAWE